MVAESIAPGASVSKVAQRYGVNANLLFTWRRQARNAASGGVGSLRLLPVTVADAGTPAAPVAASRPVGRMEIVLVGGERIVIAADVDAMQEQTDRIEARALKKWPSVAQESPLMASGDGSGPILGCGIAAHAPS